MSLPKYDEIQIPALIILNNGISRKRIEIEEPTRFLFLMH